MNAPQWASIPADAGQRHLLLSAAWRALAAGQSSAARDALERAEARVLARATPSHFNEPSPDQSLALIAEARHALASADLKSASEKVGAAMAAL